MPTKTAEMISICAGVADPVHHQSRPGCGGGPLHRGEGQVDLLKNAVLVGASTVMQREISPEVINLLQAFFLPFADLP